MVNRKKKYLGTLPTEELAARFYDKFAIQYQGAKAKTNFGYTKEQIMSVLRTPPLLAEVDFGENIDSAFDQFWENMPAHHQI